MTPPAFDISIIIVNWNTHDLLAQCLKSIFDTVHGLSLEVIVVDNGSTDGSLEMVHQDFEQVLTIANSENLGFVRANNQAFEIAQGQYLMLLNSDAALLPECATQLFDFMNEHPNVGIVGPKVLNPDGSFQTSYMDFPSLTSELLLMTKLSKIVYSRYFPSYPPQKSLNTKAVDWLQGACIMMRRETLTEVGGLDETYFMYSEEVDWCWRTKQAGWEVYYLPQAAILHWGGQSSAKVPIKRRAIIYNSKLLFVEKHYGSRTAFLFKIALLITSILKMVGWGLRQLSPNAETRNQAWDNALSYKKLISDIFGRKRK